jgi:hypothetical protein
MAKRASRRRHPPRRGSVADALEGLVPSGVSMVARASLRRQWRAAVLIGLLAGLIGAVVLASAAGARRTASALERFDSFSRHSQLEVSAGFATPSELRRFERSRGVEAVGELYQLTLTLPDGTFLPLAAAVDRRFGTTVDRPLVVEGRLPRPSAPLELAIGETLAARLHLHAGSRARFPSYSPAQVDLARRTDLSPGPPAGPPIIFHIVGVVRRPLDLGVRGGPGGVIVPTPAFFRRYHDRIGSFGGYVLRVRAGPTSGDVKAAANAARRIFGHDPNFSVVPVNTETVGASDAIDVLTTALWIFGGITLAAGFVAVAIVESRQIATEEGEQPALRALGLTRLDRTLGAGAVAVPIAIVGVVVALAGAAALSPVLPFGVARKADVDAGFHIDAIVFALGGIALVASVLLIAVIAAGRVASMGAERPSARLPATTRAAERAGIAPTLAAGLRLAIDPGRGRVAVPVRSASVGAVLGVLGIVAVMIFSAGLRHLAGSPRLYGWSFDAVVIPNGGDTGPTSSREAAASARCDTSLRSWRREPRLGALGVVCLVSVDVDGHGTHAWGYRAVRGRIEPSIVNGRRPRRADEVALGGSTLSTAGKQVGDSVRIRERGAAKRYHVVGQASFPSPSTFDAQPLADGAVLTPKGLLRLGGSGESLDTNLVARFAPGIQPEALPRDRATGDAKLHGGLAVLPTVPVEVLRLQQVDDLPTVLAALLAVLAIIAVGHAVLVAGSRRRRELAVMRTLGFRRREIRTTVLSQAFTLTLVGLVLGIPLGLAVGGLVWRATADNLGVADDPVVPTTALVALVGGAIVVTAVLGLLGARFAARRTPAAVLRTE